MNGIPDLVTVRILYRSVESLLKQTIVQKEKCILSTEQAAKYRCASGILVKEGTHVLTCAHVVASALGHGKVPQYQLEAPTGSDDWVYLDLPLNEDVREVRRAKVVGWFPVKENDAKGLQDVALLELEDTVPDADVGLMWASWEKPDYSERRFFARGFGKPVGAFSEGKCTEFAQIQGGWIELQPDKYKIYSGYSGGPVFNQDKTELIGMLVAAYDDENEPRSYIIPTYRLLKQLPTLVKVEPIGELLGATINRYQQIDHMAGKGFFAGKKDQQNQTNQCLVYQCCAGDEPQLLAQHVLLKTYFAQNTFPPANRTSTTPIRVEFKDISESGVSQVLAEAVMTASILSMKLVVTEVELNTSTSRLISAINQCLKKMVRSDGYLVVMVACHTDKPKGWYRRWLWHKIKQPEVIKLKEPLAKIEQSDLNLWWGNLPETAKSKFKSGSKEKIPIAFRGLLGKDQTKYYSQIRKDVFSIISHNLKDHFKTPTGQTL